ncbi:hypothetical protein [Nonomuraea sp. NPDC049400]|uniref:hypothetical protein n=1 Tax=Nonomuraea sp. NPDC049400 TaxID=3364352 RepID=UPI0037AC095A
MQSARFVSVLSFPNYELADRWHADEHRRVLSSLPGVNLADLVIGGGEADGQLLNVA